MAEEERRKGGDRRCGIARPLWHASQRVLLWIGAAVVGAVALIVAIAFCAYTLYWIDELFWVSDKLGVVSAAFDLPGLEKVRQPFPASTYVTDRNGKHLTCFTKEHRIPKKLGEFGPHVISAVIASEDQYFYAGKQSMLHSVYESFMRPGYDIRGIVRAGITNIGRGKVSGGGSTIFQQVLKKTVLSDERSFERKLKEAFLAVKMHQHLSDDTVFELYLNLVFLGGPYGFEAAAQSYYGKSADELTLGEAALLAGMINNPSALVLVHSIDPAVSAPAREHLRARRDRVLGLMLKNESITDADYAAAIGEPITIREFTGACARPYPYLSEMVRTAYEPVLGDLHTGGYHIVTTFDLRLQRMAEDACTKGLDQYLARHPENTETVQCNLEVAEQKTGAIVALVAGQDFKKSEHNGVVTARRVAGSAFKPFAGVAYLEHLHEKEIARRDALCATASAEECARTRAEPVNLLQDCMMNDAAGVLVPNVVGIRGQIVNRKFIHNYPQESRKSYLGWIDCVTATAGSENSAFVWSVGQLVSDAELFVPDHQKEALRWRLGAEKVVVTAKRLGIRSELRVQHERDAYRDGRIVHEVIVEAKPIIAIGFADVTLYEMVEGYMPMVNGGCARATHFVRSITDRSGTMRIAQPALDACTRVLASPVASAISAMLEGVVRHDLGTAKTLGKEFLDLSLRAKTGTATLEDGTSSGENWMMLAMEDRYMSGCRINNIMRTALGRKETGGRNCGFVMKTLLHYFVDGGHIGGTMFDINNFRHPDAIGAGLDPTAPTATYLGERLVSQKKRKK